MPNGKYTSVANVIYKKYLIVHVTTVYQNKYLTPRK